MIKRKLPPISLVLLLSLAVGDSLARFLQTSNSTGPLVTAPRPVTSGIPFASSLQCGECVVGGYIACVNGPLNATGGAPLRTVCCQNATACPQLRNTSWTCSSIYANKTTAEKLQICPFNSTQCGEREISLDSPNATQCLQLSSIQKGTACLYKVNSCGVPKFNLSDTTIFSDAVQIGNATSLPEPQIKAPSCFANSTQQCQCRSVQNSAANSSNLICDCQTVLNAAYPSNGCRNCSVFTDVLGNQLSVCQCPVQVPAQYTADQYCTCKRSGSDFLTCQAGCGIATASNPIRLPRDSCNCVNVTANNVTQLSCVCKDVKQCPDPSTIPVPVKVQPNLTCAYDYPCNCAGSNGTLSCHCSNPQTGLHAHSMVDANQCACSNTFNNRTWSQSCQCCLADEFVRKSLIPNVTCESGSIKQQCACNNSTLGNSVTRTGLNCSCAFPGNNVVENNLKYPSQGQCDCDNITLGTKNCRCCVSADIQIKQQQPVCGANTTIQSCQCQGNSTQQSCTCLSTRTGFQFANITSIPPSNCFCQGTGSLRTCNCCVSETQYQSARPICKASQTPASCSCNSVNSSLSCTCPNRYFFNTTVANVPFANSDCACYPSVNQTSNINCQCCATQQVLTPAPQCSSTEKLVKSSNVLVNLTAGTVSGVFVGSSVYSAPNDRSPLFSRQLSLNTSSCGCVQTGTNTASCSCCVNDAPWSLAQPSCNATTQNLDKCNCQNSSYIVESVRQVSQNVTLNKWVNCTKTGSFGELCNSVPVASSPIWNNSFACYYTAQCTYQTSSGKCGFTQTQALSACLAAPAKVNNVSSYQNPKPSFTNTSVAINRTIQVNETYNVTKYAWSCNCNSSQYPFTYRNTPVTQAFCGCSATNSSCSCCVSKQSTANAYFGQQTCRTSTQLADCLCGLGNNTQCTCNLRGSSLSYKNIPVDTSKCTCFGGQNNTQNCACCVGSMSSLMPAPVNCSSNTSTSQQCQCQDFVNTNNVSNYQCQCKNVTTTVTQVATVRTVMVNKTTIVSSNLNQNVSSGNSTSNQTSSGNMTTNATSGNMTTNATSGNMTTNATSGNQTTVIVTLVAENITEIKNVTSTSTVVSTQFLTRAQCSCLTYTNGSQQNQYSCNCCVQNSFSCPVSLQNQTCSCNNYTANATTKALGWNCSCTRPDNGIVGQLQFPLSLCQANRAVGTFQCCVNQNQIKSQWPSLTCPANSSQTRQQCQCNPVGKSNLLNCTCLNQNNGRPSPSPVQFLSKQCQIKVDNSGYQCCVPQVVIDTQIPYANCSQGTQNQFCQCSNFTVNVTTMNNGTSAVTKQTQYNCNCKNDFYKTSRNFNLSQCVQYNNSVSDCCLSGAQVNTLIPKLSCNSDSQPQTNCSCNFTSGTFQSGCNCNFMYQGAQYTARNLSTSSNNCMCNTTTCGCCLSTSDIFKFSERQCSSKQFRSTCDTCVSFYSNVTNSTQYNCSSCSVQVPAFTLLNQSVNQVNASQCLCRSPGANCTCCLNRMPALPAQPQCSGVTNQLVPNCACSIVNGTYSCDCSKMSGNVQNSYKNIQPTNCSCANVVRPNGQSSLQCSCCASVAQLATPQAQCQNGFTANNCTCVNNASCSCIYQNTGVIVGDINPVQSSCSCPDSNSTLNQCSCCVSPQQLIDQVTPSCPPSQSLAQCGCQNVTVTSGKTSTVQTRCSCVGNLTNSWGYVSNSNMTFSASSCSSYNITGTPVYQCCLADRQLTQVRAPQCSAGSLNATCSCPVSFNGLSRNCSCQIKTANATTFVQNLPTTSSDCNCYNLTQNGRTTQQCSCCVNQAYANVSAVVKNAVCQAGVSTAQNCICASVYNYQTLSYQNLCNCTSRASNAVQTRVNLPFSSLSQCSCINQTLNGQQNAAYCSCCVPNPPLTKCQQLALSNSSNLNCKCGYTIVNGKSEFACNCSAQVNSTKVLYVNQVLLNEQNCCCIEKSDMITGMGYKSCNCTQPAFTQKQNCQCSPVNGNQSLLSCQCSDCNNMVTSQSFRQNTCSCSQTFAPVPTSSGKASNTTNGTSSNTTSSNTTSTNTTRSNTTTGNGTVSNTTNTTRTNATTNGTRSNSSSSGNGTLTNVTHTNGTSSNGTNGTRTNTTGGNATTGNATHIHPNSTGSTNTSGSQNGTRTNGTQTNGTSTNGTRPANNTQNATSGNSSQSNSSQTTNSSTSPQTPAASLQCTCPVQFAGLCPPVDISQPVSQSSCMASNVPQLPTVASIESSASCKYQYKYLVAVVATNKDASVLLQLQDYQTQFSSYISMSLASLVLLTASMFLFY